MNLNTGGGKWVLQKLTICLFIMLFSVTQLVRSDININKIGMICICGLTGAYLALVLPQFITKLFAKPTNVVGYQGSYFDRMMTKFRWKGNPKAERINRSKLISS